MPILNKEVQGKLALKKAAVVAALSTLAGSALADPVVFSVDDATAQISSGSTTIVTVFGALFAVGSIIVVGRMIYKLLR